MLVGLVFALAPFGYGEVIAQDKNAEDIARAAIEVAIDLASDLSNEEEQSRRDVLAALAAELEQVEMENAQTTYGLNVEPDKGCRSLIAARGETSFEYLVAMRRSYACFLGAQEAGEHGSMAEQLAAVGKYAELARAALLSQVALNEATLAELSSKPFANRRSLEEAQVFLDRLKRDGLQASHRELLVASGLKSDAIEDYRMTLIGSPADEIGISIVEFYEEFIGFRRAAADSLTVLIDGGAATIAAPKVNRFLVVNPHDRIETIDLLIRRAAVPLAWRLSIISAEPPENGQAPQIQEVKAGQHYKVRLGAGEQVRVASVVVPTGPVGADTTARWAVEGRIGSELLGGMMHELYIPAVVPDLELPAVGTVVEVIDTAAAGAEFSTARAVIFAGSALAGAGIVGFYVFLRRRRRRRG